jgi:hypothetical protein
MLHGVSNIWRYVMLLKDNKLKKKEMEIGQKSVQLSITSLFRPLTPAQIAHAHGAAAMSVYMTNLPFNHFENAYVIAHHQALSPSYKPPNRKLVAGKLLNEAYDTVKSKVVQVLKSCNYLSFFTDETVNIRKERVINLCCHVPNVGCFHLKATTGVAKKMSAAVQAEWLVNGCRETINHETWRINCIATDTCFTMKAMWNEISKFSDMKHVFFVPCDSHGLQLLLGDIIEFLFFVDVMQKAQLIITSFRGLNKELAILWDFQIKAYGQHRSLILNVLTRWGTSVGLINLVLRSKEALLKYFQQKTPGIDHGKSYTLGSFVNDYSFWKRLAIAQKVLDPIHKAQHMSEAEGHKLYTVTANWNKLRSHLYGMAKEEEDDADLHYIADVVWERSIFESIYRAACGSSSFENAKS